MNDRVVVDNGHRDHAGTLIEKRTSPRRAAIRSMRPLTLASVVRALAVVAECVRALPDRRTTTSTPSLSTATRTHGVPPAAAPSSESSAARAEQTTSLTADA